MAVSAVLSCAAKLTAGDRAGETPAHRTAETVVLRFGHGKPAAPLQFMRECRPHDLDRRVPIEPRFKRQRALMQQHR